MISLTRQISPLTIPTPGPSHIKQRATAAGAGGRGQGFTVDRQTFDRLVLEHLPVLGRFAIRLTGHADAADELVQDALLNAARGWQSFRGDAAFRTWLFQIAVHAFRDGVDRRQRQHAASAGELDDDQPDERSPGPPARASAAELGDAVADAVSNLPPRQREVLVLHVYEQLSDAEVAAVLGITQQNARTTLHHARARLKQVLLRFL